MTVDSSQPRTPAQVAGWLLRCREYSPDLPAEALARVSERAWSVQEARRQALALLMLPAERA